MSKRLDRTEQLLKVLVQSSKHRLGRTQLVKLAYMADYEARRYLGRPISELEWRREPQGPFDDRFYAAKDRLVKEGLLREAEDVTPSGYPWFRYFDAGDPLDGDFSAGERRIIGYIVDKYSGVALDELLNDVYETPPFREAADSPRGTPIPMDLANDVRKTMLGGMDLEAIIAGEREVRAGETVPLSALVTELMAG